MAGGRWLDVDDAGIDDSFEEIDCTSLDWNGTGESEGPDVDVDEGVGVVFGLPSSP